MKGQTDLATADLDLAVRLRAAAAAQAKISTQKWRSANSDLERELARAMGYFVAATRQLGPPACSAIVISPAHVLTECHAPLGPAFQGDDLRLAMGKFKHLWDDAESYYEFDRTPNERADFWTIYTVHGGQQKDYWPVRLATERPEAGQPIFELGLGSGSVVRGGCRVGDWQAAPSTFLYTCGDRVGIRSDGCCEAKFLFRSMEHWLEWPFLRTDGIPSSFNQTAITEGFPPSYDQTDISLP